MMQTQRDLETRLRRDAVTIRRDAQPDASLHYRIMARIGATTTVPSVPTRSFRLPGQLVFAASLVVVALALGFALSRLNELVHQNHGAPALAGMMMAADPARHEVVLFGGGTEVTDPKSDTWTWNGSSWTLRHPPKSPPARSVFSMTYDAARGTIVIFGGMTAPQGPQPPSNLNDTWTWDGTTWKQAHSTVNPPATNGAAMAYDPSLGLTVLLDGGFTWTWDGTEWHKGPPAPPGKGTGPMAYDPATDTLVVLSLSLEKPKAPSIATWQFDGKGWSQMAGADIPVSSSPNLMAQDPLTGSLMGVDSQGRTWSWDGSRWTVLDVPKISARGGAAIAYDSTRQLVLLFGGQDEHGRTVSDLWTWDGKRWMLLQGGQQLPSPSSPPVAAQHQVAISLGVNSSIGDWLIRRPSRPNGPANGLYQSTDGGRTWQRRLEFGGIYDGMSWGPSGQSGVAWSIDMAPHGCSGGNSSCAPPSQSLSVYATSDGGQHWTARPPTAWPAYFVYFRSTNGWATSSGPASGFGAPQLYHTTDAGASWSLVGTIPEGSPNHIFGAGETPLVFANDRLGWFATRRAGKPGDSGLLVTTDGGHSWTEQMVLPPAGVNQTEMILGYPEILADGNLLLPAFVGHQIDSNNFAISRWFLYSSPDGGTTWVNPQLLEAANGVRPTGDEFQDFFLDSLQWWFTTVDQRSAGEPVPQASSAVGRTTNGGKAWEVFKSATIIQLRFSDPQHGWALAVTGPYNTNVLLRTTDGGAHWQQVQLP